MAQYISSGADISPDDRYRYLLWREWRGFGSDQTYLDLGAVDGNGSRLKEAKSCLFVMLNPSTADGEKDDPTIRRCVSFAQKWGYDRLEVVNLFAYRATNPQDLLKLQDRDEPYGIRNQDVIEHAAASAGVIVCAWGAHGSHLGHDETVMGWLQDWNVPLIALGFTRDGSPRHPLYVPSDTVSVSMSAWKGVLA